jgi:hypothetical protein
VCRKSNKKLSSSSCTCQPLFLLTWRTSFSCSWCEYPSTLVPGLLSTVHPLLLHPPQGTSQIKLHIYIDDINNISCLIWYTKYTLRLARSTLGWSACTCSAKPSCPLTECRLTLYPAWSAMRRSTHQGFAQLSPLWQFLYFPCQKNRWGGNDE